VVGDQQPLCRGITRLPKSAYSREASPSVPFFSPRLRRIYFLSSGSPSTLSQILFNRARDPFLHFFSLQKRMAEMKPLFFLGEVPIIDQFFSLFREYCSSSALSPSCLRHHCRNFQGLWKIMVSFFVRQHFSSPIVKPYLGPSLCLGDLRFLP